MNIIYDTSLSKFFYETVSPIIKNRACPFCGRRLNVNNFGGMFHYEGEPRLVHKNIICLIQFSGYQEENRGRANLFTRAKRAITTAARTLGASIRKRRTSGRSGIEDARPTRNRTRIK